jgi:hypothetical protein
MSPIALAALEQSINLIIEACRKAGLVLSKLQAEEIDSGSSLKGLGTEVNGLHVVLTDFSECIGTVQAQEASVGFYADVLHAIAGALDDAKSYVSAFQGLLDKLERRARDATPSILHLTATGLRPDESTLVGAGAQLRSHKLNTHICFSMVLAYGQTDSKLSRTS